MTDSLKVIDFKDKKFTCGGRTFYVQDSLSFNRFRELQRISIEFGFSTTFVELFKEIQKAYDFVQTNKNWGDLAVTLYNLLHGAAHIYIKYRERFFFNAFCHFANESGIRTEQLQ